jgi:cobalt/nickel transport system ATP-binding protein
MSHHITEVKNLKYSYSNGKEAVSDISFRILHGEAVGIIGANGAGKSTLLMLLMGILHPQRGDVIIGEVKMTQKTIPSIRQRIGMVFQDPNNQLFMTSVYDDVAFGPRNSGIGEDEVEQRVQHALEQVGIEHLKDRAPYRLSEGEKRAASIATVLSMQPDILVMDEPTSSLDPKSRRRFIKLINEFKHTRIITSHDLDMVYDTCERIIVLKDGLVAADGAAKEILSDEKLLGECGLELPLGMQGCPVCGADK